MRVLRALLVVGLFSILSRDTHARAGDKADTETLKVARELCVIVSKDTLKQMSAQMSSLVWPDIEQKLKGKQTISAAQVTSLRQEFERIQMDFLSKLMEDMPAIYARHFNASELREPIAFYRTPIGQKTISVLPKVSGEIMALIMPKLPKVQEEIMRSFGSILQKRGMEI